MRISIGVLLRSEISEVKLHIHQRKEVSRRVEYSRLPESLETKLFTWIDSSSLGRSKVQEEAIRVGMAVTILKSAEGRSLFV